MTKYKVKIRCLQCDHVYVRTLKSLSQADPPCPKCKTAAKEAPGIDFEGQRAPAIGGSVISKAIDETAQIVMEDYGLTNLRDDVRVGETMAPKLPPAQQAMADNMFSKKRSGGVPVLGGRGRPGINPSQLNAMGARALRGSYAAGTPDVLGTLHEHKTKPPIKIIAGD
jgi:hypothetical protein